VRFIDDIRQKLIYRLLFILSIFANVVLGGSALLSKFNSPLDRSGVLTKNIQIGIFGEKKAIFTLPKGLTV
jgi:hypothetical protein